MLPSCPHRPACPGCPRFGDPAIAPRAAEALQALATETGATLHFERGPETEFRHRARLAVRGGWRAPRIGIFRTGTHEAVDIPHCPIHHPVINRVAAACRDAIRTTRTPIYSDRTRRGVVRYVQIVVERATQQAQVAMVTNSSSIDDAAALMTAFAERVPELIHSLWWNGNPARTNAILGPNWQRVLGPAVVRESLGGAVVHYPPGAFGQSHLPLFERMVTRIHDWVTQTTCVAEYYCGVGAIGLGLLNGQREVRFNEVSPASLEGLEFGLRALPEQRSARATVLPGAASSALELLEGAEAVIVDPPRKGLEVPLRDALGRCAARQLVYVACGLEAFLRDARELRSHGWALEELVAFNLFPYTDHVETLARFERTT